MEIWHWKKKVIFFSFELWKKKYLKIHIEAQHSADQNGVFVSFGFKTEFFYKNDCYAEFSINRIHLILSRFSIRFAII